MTFPAFSAARPLQGVRVLELSQVMAGPVAGLMLADLGADVIKIEKFPGGDDARGFSSSAQGGTPPSFEVLNRGKRSMALDLKHPQGQAILRRLVQQADVLTENFRPGTMAKLGLDAKALHAVNPRLIYCSITGYGRLGPLAERGGFDLILQAFGGLISVTGEAGRPGVKPGVSIADVNAGILSAMGVLAAYIHRLKTGEGQWVETSLLQASIQQLYWYAALYFSGRPVPERMGTAHPIIAPYQTYPCADGELAVGGANETNWVRIAQVLKRPEWLEDPRFANAAARQSNRDALFACMSHALAGGTRAEWERRFNEAGVPAGPVNSVQEALSHPQVKAMDMLVQAQTVEGGTRSMIGIPLHFNGINEPNASAAPRLGEQTREVLSSFDFSVDEISDWLTDGVIYQHGEQEAVAS